MLRFSVLRIPIGVHWSFALIGILVIRNNPLELVAGFVVGVFVAVLAHELGHALTARAFGAESVKITLFGLGGLTQYRRQWFCGWHDLGRRCLSASGHFVGQ